MELERADCDLTFFANIVKHSETTYMLIALQCVEALLCIHETGLVHCDIKPSNILLKFDVNGNFWVKLCDFGLSHLAGKELKAHIKGTSGYIDPRAFLL